MEYFLSTTIKHLILSIQAYNRKIQFRNIEDPQITVCKGRIEALFDLLKDVGYPVSWGYGAVWSPSAQKFRNGYGYISFVKNEEGLKESGIYDVHGFDNGTYWFVDRSGCLTEYKGGV